MTAEQDGAAMRGVGFGVENEMDLKLGDKWQHWTYLPQKLQLINHQIQIHQSSLTGMFPIISKKAHFISGEWGVTTFTTTNKQKKNK